METVYKLTDANDQTHGGMQWGENVTHTADGKSDKLCNCHWLHAYPTPVLAVLMDPVHGKYGTSAHMWVCDAVVGLRNPDKLGCAKITTLTRMEAPTITREQKVRFAILVAKAVRPLTVDERMKKWDKWADDRLSGKTHSRFYAAAYAAAYTAAYADAADAAAAAAYADAADAAYAAAYAAYAAAAAALGGKIALDLVAISKQAMEE
jgi:hypothetical protein